LSQISQFEVTVNCGIICQFFCGFKWQIFCGIMCQYQSGNALQYSDCGIFQIGQTRQLLTNNALSFLPFNSIIYTEGKERPLVKYPATDRAIDRLVVLTKQTGRVWYPEDFEKGNVKREESARDKIRQALHKLVEEGRRITIKGLERLSGCRRETVRRHSDIWAALRLSKRLGDLICPRVAILPSLESSDPIQSEPLVEIPVAKSESVCFSSLREPVLESPQKLFGFSPLLTAWKASPDFSMVFEILRLKIYGATANNSTAMAVNDLLAATSFDFSSGVNTGASKACRLVKPLVSLAP
jgi:hypothetical protein